MTVTRIDGKALAEQLREDVAEGVKALKAAHGITPGLAVVLVGEDPASQVYVRNKVKQTEACGMRSFHHVLEVTTSRDSLISLIEMLNNDLIISGSSGFIGTNLLNYLQNQNIYKVKKDKSNEEIYFVDSLNNKINKLESSKNFTFIHLATFFTKDISLDKFVYESNYQYGERILNKLEKYKVCFYRLYVCLF